LLNVVTNKKYSLASAFCCCCCPCCYSIHHCLSLSPSFSCRCCCCCYFISCHYHHPLLPILLPLLTICFCFLLLLFLLPVAILTVITADCFIISCYQMVTFISCCCSSCCCFFHLHFSSVIPTNCIVVCYYETFLHCC